MKIAVIGAGAMGSLFGGRLAESGNDVVLIDVNPAHVDAINGAGLRLDADDGDRRIRVPAGPAESFSGAKDLLVVFTKGMHTDKAVASARHLIGQKTWALTVQNGLGNTDVIARYVKPENVAFGMTNFPADLKGPGHVASHGSGAVSIWTVSGLNDPRINEFQELLSAAGLPCKADPQVEVAIWEKVVFNAALNSISAVTKLTVGAIGDHDEGRSLAQSIVAETLAIAKARGLAVDEQRARRALEHAFNSHRSHQPSMLQDVLAGRPTEIATINGAIVAAGKARGIEAPVTESLFRLVKLIEANPLR